jgi:hypothetical protein
MPRTRQRKERDDTPTGLDDCVEVIEPNQTYLATEEEDGLRFDIYTLEEQPGCPPLEGRWAVDCIAVDELDDRWQSTECGGIFRDVVTAKRSLRRTMLTGRD